MTRAALVAFAVGLALALVAPPSPSTAQTTTLVSSTPEPDATLTSTPPEVTLEFADELNDGSIRVFGATAEPLALGPLQIAEGGNRLTASLPQLGDGDYLVAWEITTAEGGEATGGFGFHVDGSGVGARTARTLVVQSDGDDLGVRLSVTTVRLMGWLGLIVLVGTASVIDWAWPRAVSHKRVRGLLWIAWATALTMALAGFVLESVRGTSLGLARALDPSLWSDVIETGAGLAWLARALILGLAAPALAWLTGGHEAPRSMAFRATGVVLSTAALAMAVLSGHGGGGHLSGLGFGVALTHLWSVAIVVGVITVAMLLRDRRDELDVEEVALVRAVTVATALTVLTGLIESWRLTGSTEALTDTGYGQLVLVKAALGVGLVVTVAFAGRSLIEGRQRAALAAGTVVVAVGITSLLAGERTGRSEVGMTVSVSQTAQTGALEMTVAPAEPGQNELHVYLFDESGAPADLQDAVVELSFPDQDIGPVSTPVIQAGPNHFLSYDVTLPFSGDWEVGITATGADGDSTLTVATLEVR